MAKINLLPWREERREQLRKEFLAVLGGVAALAVIVVGLALYTYDARIDRQQARNAYLQQHIDELNKQVEEIRELKEKRAQLIDRMKVIQGLQGSRPLIVRIFDSLVRAIPEGVYFTSVERKGDVLTIKGTAESNNRVSSLMRQLDASEWLKEPSLTSVQANPEFGDQANDFQLTVKIESPEMEAEAEAKAGKSPAKAAKKEAK